ncbi:TVP38/TMEM64 family protein [Roseateles sp.]|uniref:TVP38/TMEM64 family protein n=1 Tax=Roseateles sp. TaxID=1971397 RepID=UPI003BA59538
MSQDDSLPPVDPARPSDPASPVTRSALRAVFRSLHHPWMRLLMLGLCLLALLGMAVYWSFSGPDLKQSLTQLQATALQAGPLWLLALFTLALTLAVPLGLLALLMIAALGPWTGFAAVIIGALLSASISHALGHLLGHQALQRVAGPKVRLLSQALGRRGFWAVVTIRMVPIAPYAVVNMVAGATHIRLRDLLLGSAIGISPSMLAMAFFADWILAWLQHPEDLAWPALLLVLGLIVLLSVGLRWRGRQQAKTSSTDAE